MRMNSENAAPGQLGPARKPQVSLLRVLALLIPALILFCSILFHVVWRSKSQWSPHVVCIAHLKQIEYAKASWALEHKKLPTDVPTDADLFGRGSYIVEKPICPERGTYTLGAMSEKPRCSIPKHVLAVDPER